MIPQVKYCVAYLYNISNKIWQDFILLDLLSVVANLLFHNALLMLALSRVLVKISSVLKVRISSGRSSYVSSAGI
jgi:hypothetical protein